MNANFYKMKFGKLAFWFSLQLFVSLTGEICTEINVFNEQAIREQMGYGREWIFFPDGDGIPHFVNLSIPDVAPKLRTAKLKEIEYRLYARNIYDYVLLDQSAKTSPDLKMDHIISNKPIKIVTHGWMSSAEKSVIMNIKDAYLAAQDVIVIGIDWSDTAMNLMYPSVAQETGEVGSRVGQFLSAFCKLYNVAGDRLHLIGHSCGAHIVGIAASTSNVAVGRITGLDPARPLFEYPKKPDALALDKSDAAFVDVIHSCGGILGVQNSVGHADFYPNSGAAPQPGCDSIFFLLEACSHSRSHIYFAESIGNPFAFPSCQSANWNEYLGSNECHQQTYMGESVDRNASGQYYLKTNPKKPYGRIKE